MIKKADKMKKITKLEKIIKVAAAFLVLLLCENVRELHTFKMTRYRIASDKIKGTHKILFLSDLHNQIYGKKNDRLFHAIQKEQPELILIGGDMLVGKTGYDYRAAADFIKRLPALCPVYYANGNHEQRMKEAPEKYDQSYQAYKQELVAAGIHFLENKSEVVVLKDTTIKLSGLEIPKAYYIKFKKKNLPESIIRNLLGDGNSSVYHILLAHDPSYIKEYLMWGADLVLSGHFHGGVVRIPWFRGILSPDFKIFPKYAGGCYPEGEQTVVVSRGLGTHTIPVRLFNPAEIVVLNLVQFTA